MRVGPAFEAKLFAWCAHSRRRAVGHRPKPKAPTRAHASAEPEPSPCICCICVCVTRCASSGVTTITISHNLELRAHHTHELQLNGCGVPPQLKLLHHGADEEGGSASSGEVVGGEMGGEM